MTAATSTITRTEIIALLSPTTRAAASSAAASASCLIVSRSSMRSPPSSSRRPASAAWPMTSSRIAVSPQTYTHAPERPVAIQRACRARIARNLGLDFLVSSTSIAAGRLVGTTPTRSGRRHHPPGSGEAAELTAPRIVREQLTRAEHLPAARSQPRRHPGAAAQVSPPCRPRIGGRRRRDLSDLDPEPGCKEKRAVAARQRSARDPAGARQPCGVRPCCPRHPAHRAAPRIDRRRSHPRQPAQALDRRRTRTQLPAHRAAVPFFARHPIVVGVLVPDVVVDFDFDFLFFISMPPAVSCCSCMAWRSGPRPRLHTHGHRARPTTRMTSWRAGSRSCSACQSPVLTGVGATRSPAQRAAL